MVDHELDELRREFLAEARGKVGEMVTALEAAATAESLERLAYLAHQLKGSGGSYGYPRISVEAAKVEKGVESIAERTRGNGSDAGTTIQHDVASLREEIEKCAREL